MKNPQTTMESIFRDMDVLHLNKKLSPETNAPKAYEEYTLESIKLQTVHHLLKSIDIGELLEVVAEIRARSTQAPKEAAPAGPPVKIGFPVATGQEFVKLENVIYARAKNGVAELILTDGKKVKLTKSLVWLEKDLADYGFQRIHHSYLINMRQLKEYIRNEGGFVVMSNGKAISISRRRKDAFLQRLEERKFF